MANEVMSQQPVCSSLRGCECTSLIEVMAALLAGDVIAKLEKKSLPLAINLCKNVQPKDRVKTGPEYHEPE